MKKSTRTIVGTNNQNLSSALDSIPSVHVRFTTNDDDEYQLIKDNDKKTTKKVLKRKSIATNEFDRQISTIHRKIDQFQVKKNGY
jgi:hypothetical protein